MKHLYTFTAAAILLAASASAQQAKHPDGLTPELERLKAAPRTAVVNPGLRGGGGPANDECSGAIVMTVGTSCAPVTATLAGATESQPAAACSGFTSATANDVWFTFTATGASTIISVTGGAGTTDPDTTGIDPVLQVFTGGCDALTAVGCIDATLPGGTTEAAQVVTTPGTTYYYRVYYWDYGVTPENFEITTCVYSLVAPDNDDCAGAFPVTVDTWCNLTLASGVGATQSLPAIACGGFTGNANDDVWFSFVATQTTMTVGAVGSPNPTTPNQGYDAVLEAFDACGGTSLGCADATLNGEAESLELTGLTVGNTYYFRVYHFFTAGANPYTVGGCAVEGGGISIGLPELVAGQEWVVYPNPAAGVVNLSYGGRTGMGAVEIFDIAGRKAFEQRGTLLKGTTQAIDITALATGTYTVRVTVDGHRTEQRFVVE
ncbi:MAG: T9SS type A sorting domain-containing protein [Flavobacteriales bacterium]|mgnify:CR=1 FL=1|jgi:hypothetical protein|nr:MAG: T9SS type A sorting domain-containing protein [Flavobacteriales bacterium]